MQVCNLCGNKLVKQLSKSECCILERKKNNRRKYTIKIKITHAQILKFVKEAISKFNTLQFEDGNSRQESISSIFQKLSQSYWFIHRDELLIEHLSKLKENVYCKRDIENNIQNNAHEDMSAEYLVFS